MAKSPSDPIEVIDAHGYRTVTLLGDLDRTVEITGLSKFVSQLYGSDSADACPACRHTLEEAKSSGLMGCAACYEFIYPLYASWISANSKSVNENQ